MPISIRVEFEGILVGWLASGSARLTITIRGARLCAGHAEEGQRHVNLHRIHMLLCVHAYAEE
jgi:hypothetical protein